MLKNFQGLLLQRKFNYIYHFFPEIEIDSFFSLHLPIHKSVPHFLEFSWRERRGYMKIVPLTKASENFILHIPKRIEMKEAYKLWNFCAFWDCHMWWYITQVFIQQILACLPIEREVIYCCNKSNNQTILTLHETPLSFIWDSKVFCA